MMKMMMMMDGWMDTRKLAAEGSGIFRVGDVEEFDPPELGTIRCPPWLLKDPWAVQDGSRLRARLWFRRFMVSLLSSSEWVT